MISSRLSEMPWGAAIENNGIERRQNPWLFLTVKIVIDQCRRPEAGAIAKVGKKRTCKFSNRKLQFEPASLRVLKRDGEGEGRGEGVSPTTQTQIKVLSGPLLLLWALSICRHPSAWVATSRRAGLTRMSVFSFR